MKEKHLTKIITRGIIKSKEVEGMKVSITKDKILETIKRCEISETGHSEINGLCFEISWHKSKNTKKEKEKIIKAVEHALKIYTANQHLIDPGIKHIVVRAIIKWLYPDAWIDPKIVTPYNVKQRLTIDDKNSYPLDGIYPKFPNKITLWFGYNDKFSITLEFPTLRKMLETLQDIYASQTPVNNLVEIETKKFSDDWLVEKGYNSVTLFRITQK